jgi:hypothetical protein
MPQGEMMKVVLSVACLLSLVGCVAMPQPDMYPITDEKREFTFDYAVPGKTQQDLYRSARNYLATAYVDSRAVTRMEDEAEGTIIGKGIAPWNYQIDSPLIPFQACGSNYDIIFIAKEGRARLRLTLKEGAAFPATCNVPLPTKRDYPQIVSQFHGMSNGLERALNGNGVVDQLRNF